MPSKTYFDVVVADHEDDENLTLIGQQQTREQAIALAQRSAKEYPSVLIIHYTGYSVETFCEWKNGVLIKSPT